MDKESKIFVAGHRGLVGSAVNRKLKKLDYNNVIGLNRSKLNLTNQNQVDDFFEKERPDYVFLSAAKVGGIGYNKEMPADFIRENLQIQTNVIDAAYRNGCKKLLFLGSACIYPKLAPVPIKEEYLMTGPLEETNISYSLAKIAGYMMCKKYTEQYGFPTVSVMPNNLYGVNDNFILDQCHVIPSFINKFINAKDKNLPSVVCFGDGSPTREFLFSDDLADGLIFLMDNYNDPEIINIGPNREVSIKELSELIAKTVGYTGEIVWDTTKPNGTPRRALDTSRMDSLGWKSQTSLEDGLNITIDWFLKNRENYVRV
ncbi:GDP-L-fucose synthase [archaeon]|nr:GDP-L-fucose synthase [archaeon]